MRLHHTAIWTQRLEELRDFYVRYFDGRSGAKYVNPAKGFESYFVSFGDGCRLELMRRTDIDGRCTAPHIGLCHIAFAYDSRDEVLAITERLRTDGYRITGEPRTTGDGYFESVAEDCDGNTVELVYKQQ